MKDNSIPAIQDVACAPYESPCLRAVTGDTLRPGGLDITQKALELAALTPPSTVLDVGCGVGASMAFLRQQGFQCIGCDRSQLLVKEALTHGPAVLGEAGALPFAAHSVEAVLCECVLSLTPDPGQTLRECARVLKPGGVLLLSDIVLRDEAKQRRTPVDGGCLQGALEVSVLHDLLRDARLTVRSSSDFTCKLKELAARLVWAYGERAPFFPRLSAPRNEQTDTGKATGGISTNQYGYMLFVAQRSL